MIKATSSEFTGLETPGLLERVSVLASAPQPAKLCIDNGFKDSMDAVGRHIPKHVSRFEMSFPDDLINTMQTYLKIKKHTIGSIFVTVTRDFDRRLPRVDKAKDGTNTYIGVCYDQIVIYVAPEKKDIGTKLSVQICIQTSQEEIC